MRLRCTSAICLLQLAVLATVDCFHTPLSALRLVNGAARPALPRASQALYMAALEPNQATMSSANSPQTMPTPGPTRPQPPPRGNASVEESLRFLAAAVLIGILTGLAITVFKTTIAEIAAACYKGDEVVMPIVNRMGLGGAAVLIPAGGGLVVGMLRLVSPRAQLGPGLAEHVAQVERAVPCNPTVRFTGAFQAHECTTTGDCWHIRLAPTLGFSAPFPSVRAGFRVTQCGSRGHPWHGQLAGSGRAVR